MKGFWGDVFLKNAQKNAFPALRVGQLLRSCEQTLEEGAGFLELGFDFGAFGVAEVDADAGLAGDTSEKFGAGGDGLTVPLAVHESRIEAPPVVDLGDESGGDLAAVEVLRGEPGPTPLVLEFVKGVLGVAPPHAIQ